MFEFIVNNFAQIVGFVALALIVTAFQINDRSKLITVQSSSLFLYGIHFYFLGAYSGAAMQFIGVIRNYVFVKYRKRFIFPWLPMVFIIIFSFGIFMTWESFISLLPLGAMIFGTLAFWQERTRWIRILNLFGPILFFIYSYIINSYSGMLGMAFIFVSVCVAVVRYDVLHKPEPGIISDKLKIGD